MDTNSNLIPPVAGEVRNPNGRPKGSRNRSTIAREWLEVNMKQKNPITKEVETMEVQDAVTLALIGKALKGDVAAFKEVMDSAYGKLQNYTDVTSKGENIQGFPTLEQFYGKVEKSDE